MGHLVATRHTQAKVPSQGGAPAPQDVRVRLALALAEGLDGPDRLQLHRREDIRHLQGA